MITEGQEKYIKYFGEKASAENGASPKELAFDMIAERFYFTNFGTMSKTDFETLMFSIYIEQILKVDEDNIEAYSDYTLSKALGISQFKVSSLKVRKQLMHPSPGFQWREALSRIAHKAVYEDNKIKLMLSDKNLYLEIKNAIKVSGRYIELQLSPDLLQLRLEYFLDLMIAITQEAQQNQVHQGILERVLEQVPGGSYEGETSIKSILADVPPSAMLALIEECVPLLEGTVRTIAETLYGAVKKKQGQKNTAQ